MKILFVTLITIVFLACYMGNTKPGLYVTHSPLKLELLNYKIRGYEGYAMGNSLLLNMDSSFQYKTCGHILNGSWSDRNDSIFLNINEAKEIIDKDSSRIISLQSLEFYRQGISFKKKKGGLLSTKDNRVNRLVQKIKS